MRQIYLNNRKQTGFKIQRNAEQSKQSIMINLKPDIDLATFSGMLLNLQDAAEKETMSDPQQLHIYLEQTNICLLKYKILGQAQYEKHVYAIQQNLATFEKHFQMLLGQTSYISYLNNISLILNNNQSLDDLPLLGNEIELNEREDFSRERTELRKILKQQYAGTLIDNVEQRPYTPIMVDQQADSEDSCLVDMNSNLNLKGNTDNLLQYINPLNSENTSLDNTSMMATVGSLNSLIQSNTCLLKNLQAILDLFTTYTFVFEDKEINKQFLLRNYEMFCQLFSIGYQIIKLAQGFSDQVGFIKMFYEQQQSILQIFNNVITYNENREVLEQIVTAVYQPLIKNILFYESQYEIIHYIFKVCAFLLIQKLLVQSILHPQNGMIYQIYCQYISNQQFKEKIDYHFIELLDQLFALSHFFDLINKEHLALFSSIIKYFFDEIMKDFIQNILKLDHILTFNSLLRTYLSVYDDLNDPLMINDSIIKPYIANVLSQFGQIKDQQILISYLQLFLSISPYFNEFDEALVEICLSFMLTLNEVILYWVGNLLNYLSCKSIELFSQSYQRVYDSLNKVQLTRNVNNESKYLQSVVHYLVDIAQTLLQQYFQPELLPGFITSLQQFSDMACVGQFLNTWTVS